MTASGFALFDTAIGRCGVAWGEHGVAGVQLPEAGEAETRARMLHRFPAAGETAPPPEVQQTIERIAALLRGEASDLAGAALDMDQVPEFHRRVYDAARTIPPGETLSYGDIARRVGVPGAARAVGKAAAAIFARVCALFPDGAPTPERMLGIPDEQLRGAGLSRTKLLSLRDLAQRVADGRLPTLAEIQGMPDETIVERLSEVRGIGRWTAEMLLMFRLGRPDVLPVDDYGVRQGFAIAYERELWSPKELAAYGGRWKPYRTVASWYLWRVVERAKARTVMPLASTKEEA